MNESERFSPKEMSSRVIIVDRELKTKTRKRKNKPHFTESQAFSIFKDACLYMKNNNVIDRYFLRFVKTLNYFNDIENSNAKDSYTGWHKYLLNELNLSNSSFDDAFIGRRTAAFAKYETNSISLGTQNNTYELTYIEWDSILRMCFQHNIGTNCKSNSQKEIMISSFGGKVLSYVMQVFGKNFINEKPTSSFFFSVNQRTRGRKKYTDFYKKENHNSNCSLTKETINNEISVKDNFINHIRDILSNYYYLNGRIFSNNEYIPGDILSSKGIKLMGYTFILFKSNEKTHDLVVLSDSNASNFKCFINQQNRIII